MFKTAIKLLFSKKAIIVTLTLLGLLLVVFSLIEQNYVLGFTSILFFSLAILEEKTNLLVEKIASRAVVIVIYFILAAILISIPSILVYYKIYLPHYYQARHHLEYLPINEITDAFNDLPFEERTAVSCRHFAEKLLGFKDQIDGVYKPIYYYYDFTDEEISHQLSKMTPDEVKLTLDYSTESEIEAFQFCTKQKIGGW